MTSSKSSVIQLNDDPDLHTQLQFQDFSPETSSGIATMSPTGTYNFQDSPDGPRNESEDLLGSETERGSSFWKFSYYQSFFDIETSDFLERLKWSFIPMPGRSTFLDRHIRPKADLYGPFWITFCLVYATAIMANVANYFNGTIRDRRSLTFNFHRVSLSAFLIYSYVFLLPIVIWGALRHFQFSNRFTLLEIICVYGYSLAIFIPIALFWIFDAAWLHWILVIIGTALTGAVLGQVFWPIFRDDNKKAGTVLLIIILSCHVLLGLGFGTLFFTERVNWTPTSPATIVATTTTTSEVHLPSKMSRSIEDSKTSLQQLETTDKTNNSVLASQVVHSNIAEGTGNLIDGHVKVKNVILPGPNQDVQGVKGDGPVHRT